MSQSSEPGQDRREISSSPRQLTTAGSCHPVDVWNEVASGALPESEAMALLSHSATCKHCSNLLRAATQRFAEESTAEEDAFLGRLSTSTSEGQKRLASRLLTETSSAHAPRRNFGESLKRPRVWLWAAVGLATAGILLLAFFGYKTLRPISDSTLLARAYDKHRLSELRIPGSLAVGLVSPTRGKTPGDISSTELLKVKLRAQQAFEKYPNDASLRQTLGRIAIVEHDGETALREFEMAEALNPHLPGLKFDFGTAYFEIAESTDKPLNYARAIDFFGQYLQEVHQQDSVALFDQGLCWERENVDSEAIKDFEAALTLEKDPGWRKEIAEHLQTLKTRDVSGGASAPKPADLTPAAFLALHGETPGEYEMYLDASRAWLPHRAENPEAADALRQLAAIGAKHGDAWLGDMLKQPPTPAEIAAEQTLAQALEASAKGNADEAVADSAAAIKLFTKTSNQPGLLRARVEHVYSLRSMGQAKDCLSEATPLIENVGLARYEWQRINLELEVSTCHALRGEISMGLQYAEDASNLARSNGLTSLGLRATGFIIATNFRQGHFQASWRIASTTLPLCWTLPESGYRQYQLLFELERTAKTLNLSWTQAGLAEAAAQAASTSKNVKTAAFAFEELALAQLKVNSNIEAGHSFKNADRVLTTLGQGAAATRYRADWQSDRVLLRAREQGPVAATQALADQEAAYQESDVFLARLHYYTTYAELLRESHHTQESLEKAQRAIADAEHLLLDIRTEQERRAWVEAASSAYHILTLDLVDIGQIPTALRSWEWFHTAPFRAKSKLPTYDSTKGAEAAFSPIPMKPAGALTLIYARVQDQYIAWSVSDDPRVPLRFRNLSIPVEDVANQVRALDRLCEDPHSSQQDIGILGTVLYNTLLAPFQDQIDHSQQVRLDLDPSLARIPFAVLMHDGHFFGLEHPLLFLPPWWTLSRAAEEQALTSQDRLPEHARLLVVRESSSDPAARIPQEYEESRDIVARFPQAQLQPASLHRSGSTLTIIGGAALQSMLADADLVHYSGHGLDENSTMEAPAAHAGQTMVQLDSSSLKRCRLAVLSACRTLIEREDATEDDLSFERIVLASGASHVVGAQWDVDSAMTRNLMVRFYAELADRQTFAESLRRAQQQLQSDQASSHPYFWSAFQLVGQ